MAIVGKATRENHFSVVEGGTLLTIVSQYPSREALQTVLDMGMEEGLTMAQTQLLELLHKLG